MRRRQRAKPERARDEVEAERQRHQAEITAEQQRAAHREAELREQVTALTVRAEQAEAREQAAAASLSTLKQDVEALRHELNQNENNVQKMHLDLVANSKALSQRRTSSTAASLRAFLKESQQRQHLQLQLNEARRHFRVQEQELEATDAKLTEESQQREHLQLQLMTIQRQLGAERRQWQDARALLTQHAQEEQSQLVADNRQLRYLLAELESRTQATAGTPERQLEVGNQEHRSLERKEEIQRKQLADPQEEPKRLSGTKEQRPLPAVSGLYKTGLLMTLRAVKSVAEDTPPPDRKRLPPKRY